MKQKDKAQYEKLLQDVKAKGPKAVGMWRESQGGNVDILTPEEFYSKLSKPCPSPAHKFFQDLAEGKADIEKGSRLVCYNLSTNEWKWKKVNNAKELKEMIKKSEGAEDILMKLREARTNEFLRKAKKTREDFFDGGGDDLVFTQNGNISGYEVKHEYTPLLGTPFFKQMYLQDYLLMHSKVFWYKNYSGPAKHALNVYRSFVIGEGYSVTCDDDKAKKVWDEYEERNELQKKLCIWHDELAFAGEIMLEKKLRPDGLVHESIDPSTVWEIVTDPENISDIKYYHQQYPTQYQIFGDEKTPMTKYILRQIPPDLIIHEKINVTSWEKRGRSDLLAALLYLKYFDDYIGFKLQRTKAEAAYFWDVMIKGDANDVANYIATTNSIVDVAPGSENVHNEAVARTPIQPSLSHTGSDEVAKWILSYIAMSVGLPASYWGTFEQQGASRASALVGTEPVTKLMEERRQVIERLLHKIFADVMVANGLDPETEIEFNFPELVVEDRSKKLQDVIMAINEQVISHETGSNIIAKELNITTYDYDEEQKKIDEELQDHTRLMSVITPNVAGQDLTSQENPNDTQGDHAFDRSKTRDENTAGL